MKRPRKLLSIILKDSAFTPLDIKHLTGFTEFEKKVYLAVSGIPRGEVRSYKEIAELIGRPKSYRAVGNALNKNMYPETIPCHRVVRSDSSAGGYRKGTARKLRLLKREGVDFRRRTLL